MGKTAPVRTRTRRVVLLLLTIVALLATILGLWPRGDGGDETATAGLPATDRTTPARSAPDETSTTAEEPAPANVPVRPQAAERADDSPAVVTEGPAVAAAAPGPPEASGGGMLVVVLDDAGQNLEETRRFMSFPGFLYVSVLPQLPYSASAARLARESGMGVLLHCPMEPAGPEDPGPGAILTSSTPEEVASTFRENLRSVGEVDGFNNHMGSLATADPVLMRQVMALAQERGLAFVDSRTTAESVALDAARAAGVWAVARDVFLDNAKDAASIRAALEEGLEVARRQGYAVLIGHVHSPELAAVLSDEYERLVAEGYCFGRLGDIPSARTGRER